MKEGKFIVFEGIDGSGVSTHSAMLREWLVEKRHRVLLTAEPTDGPVGALIRQILRGFTNIKKRPDILALLFAADRLYHVFQHPYGTIKDESREGIKNALHEGYIVIGNRYLLSSLAYQSIPSGGVKVDMEWLARVNNPNGGIPIPDLTIFLDVPPKESISRIQSGRQRYELFENYDDLEAVYQRFKEIIGQSIWNIAQIKGVKPKGGAKSVQEVQGEIRNEVEILLAGKQTQRESKLDVVAKHEPKETISSFVEN